MSLAKFGAASSPAHAEQLELEPQPRCGDVNSHSHVDVPCKLAMDESNRRNCPPSVVAMSRRERSRARTQAIIELGSEGQDTWDLRRAEKSSRLVDLNTFSE
eukprot:5820224-Amphidinium_carterae.1